MTEENGSDKIKLTGSKPLSLRRTVESGHIRQSQSRGRSKSVVVEKKRKRIITIGTNAAAPAKADDEKSAARPKAISVKSKKAETAGMKQSTASTASGAADGLTDHERDTRTQALAEAKRRTREQNTKATGQQASPLSVTPPQEMLSESAEPSTAAAPGSALGDVTAMDLPSAKPASPKREATPTGSARAGPARAGPTRAGPARTARGKKGKPANGEKQTAKPNPMGERRRSKLTIANALSGENSRQRSLAAMRRAQEREKRRASGETMPQQKISRAVVIPETITVQELANRMAERAVDVIKLLMKQDQMVQANDVIDADTAQLITEEMGHTVKRISEADVEAGLEGETDLDSDLKPRAPVVTIMGHVDHGKTSLLDALRETDVVSGEAGGITQHIGAYQVILSSNEKITFLDTPGHAAFTAMRARGAQLTDIVVLVVAADDGLMPQTEEAIIHAREAQVPIIVAINKMDKAAADPVKTRNELMQKEVFVESMGGDVLDVEISALKKTNLDKLEEAILLQAELLELKANPDRAAAGVVIEAKLDKNRGPMATVLVQRGTLKISDVIVAGGEWGKVRALSNDRGEQVDHAGPSVPVEVLGLSATPLAGDQLVVVESETRAREITEYRQRARKEKQLAQGAPTASLDQILSQLKAGKLKEMPLLIKADVQGSSEAIIGALEKLGNEEVAARVVHAGVGGITESDVTLALASKAPIIGFNVRANQQARIAAQREGVEIRYYSIIYNLVDDVKAVMTGMLDPALRENFLGNAKILEVFNITKVGQIAGCQVTEGVVHRGVHVRLIRDDVVIHEGKLSTLKRFKDEVKEVAASQECGMGFENYQDLRAGDVIECFEVEEIARTLDDEVMT